MSANNREAAVFLLMGQSNATGYAVPMKEQDRITEPLPNVFGLSRERNQSYENRELFWSGYTSDGMNLAEEYDHSYSIANELARLWQAEFDGGADLPELYIVHIAIGAQGIMEPFLWYPDLAPVLIPGPLGTVRIALYPFAVHILSLLRDSFDKLGKQMNILGLHWLGSEEDMSLPREKLEGTLPALYRRMIAEFRQAAGVDFPFVLHKIVCWNGMDRQDPTGGYRRSTVYINEVFDELSRTEKSVSVFDPVNAPMYDANAVDSGMFMGDLVHFTPDANRWKASEILRTYRESR